MKFIDWIIYRFSTNGVPQFEVPKFDVFFPTDKIDMALIIPKDFREAKILRSVFEKIAKEYEKSANEAIQRYCKWITECGDMIINGTGGKEPRGIFNSESSEGVKDEDRV